MGTVKDKRLDRFHTERERMRAGGGKERSEAQRQKGKLTARERIKAFVDDRSFVEEQAYVLGRAEDFGLGDKHYLGDGVVSGYAQVDGRPLCLAAQDFTVLGGSLGEMQAERIASVQERALSSGVPFVQINDSGGARIQEGILALQGYGRIFRNNTLASGVIPQITLIVGPCAGGAVYSPAITDFIIMVDGISQMYITGPDVIKTVTGEEISHEALGGAGAHSAASGVAHFRLPDEKSALGFIRRLLGYLPLNNRESSPRVTEFDSPDRECGALLDVIPSEGTKSYDVRDCIRIMFDTDSFLEVQGDYAPNVVVGFARLAGRTVGIFANQTNAYAAAMDINASDKGARFLRFCDAFNIPIVSLVDVPGFLPGVAQEHGGIIRHGAKILYAIAEATVPKIAVILRKAYGGAYISMAAKSLGYDRVIAFPFAEIAVMGAEGAVNIVFRREIAGAAPEGAGEKEAEQARAQRRTEKINEFKESVMSPYRAASFGYVDAIIDPTGIRSELVRSLGILERKSESRPRKKHGNIPL